VPATSITAYSVTGKNQHRRHEHYVKAEPAFAQAADISDKGTRPKL